MGPLRKPILALLPTVIFCGVAWPHPHAESAVSSYSLIELRPEGLFLHHMLEYGPFHTSIQMRNLDPDHDGRITPVERERYQRLFVAQLRRQLRLTDEIGSPIENTLQDTTATLWRARRGEGEEIHLRVELDMRLPDALRKPGRRSFALSNEGYLRYPGDLLIEVRGLSGMDVAVDASDPSVKTETRSLSDREVRILGRRFEITYSVPEGPGSPAPANSPDINAIASLYIVEQKAPPPNRIEPDSHGIVWLPASAPVSGPAGTPG